MPLHLDDIDRQIVAALVDNGRLPNNVLAERLGIAASTCLARTRALVDRGVIRGFHADVNYPRLGDLQAVISVRVRPNARPSLSELGRRLAREQGVLSVFFVAGAFDFMIHVVARDTEGLREFVVHALSANAEIESTQTSLVFEHIPGTAAWI
ncbi:MAG: Lrp/AsnC family transcriptional regulator [Candidatus Nanopelagicales bacterium]|jgi:DNA-binding Lrp family transcriptional regulator